MRLIVQRASYGKVEVNGETVSETGDGYVVLCGIKKGDSKEDANALAKKLVNIRIMKDGNGKMNLSILEMGGEILVISQFTLYAQTQGRRPGFTDAEEPEKAKVLFDHFVEQLRGYEVDVSTGSFGEFMKVELCNDGPTTIILES